ENGPVKATVVVKGWYGSDPGRLPQALLCRYVTQITAFADSSILRISHRTILTFDPDQIRLADVGWRVPTSLTGPARFGIDGGVRQLSAQGGGVFLHQDRHDRCWLLTTQGTNMQRQGPMRHP